MGVGVNIPQHGYRANVYAHVAVVHGRDWRTLCSEKVVYAQNVYLLMNINYKIF